MFSQIVAPVRLKIKVRIWKSELIIQAECCSWLKCLQLCQFCQREVDALQEDRKCYNHTLPQRGNKPCPRRDTPRGYRPTGAQITLSPLPIDGDMACFLFVEECCSVAHQHFLSCFVRHQPSFFLTCKHAAVLPHLNRCTHHHFHGH